MSSTEVSRVLTPHEQFQENLKDRIRKDIGELMPDSALSELIQKTVEELLLKEEKYTDSWGNTEFKENWFKSEIRKEFKGRTEKFVTEWFENNEKHIQEIAGEFLEKHAHEIMLMMLAQKMNYTPVFDVDLMVRSALERMGYRT